MHTIWRSFHPGIFSSKSNNLPDWQRYFPLFADLEYHSYLMIWKYEKVHTEFDKCAREHLNSPEIEHRLYGFGLNKEEFVGRLSDVIYPLYQSAKSCGFRNWVYGNK